ncbi:MAG: hypothetical protein AAGD35_22920 [Actinomycetota bacterium]
MRPLTVSTRLLTVGTIAALLLTLAGVGPAESATGSRYYESNCIRAYNYTNSSTGYVYASTRSLGARDRTPGWESCWYDVRVSIVDTNEAGGPQGCPVSGHADLPLGNVVRGTPKSGYGSASTSAKLPTNNMRAASTYHFGAERYSGKIDDFFIFICAGRR